MKRRMQPSLRFVCCALSSQMQSHDLPFLLVAAACQMLKDQEKRRVCVQCLKAKEDLTGCGTGVTPCFCVCVGWYGSATPALLETEQSKSERVTPSLCVDSGGKMLEATFDKT